MIDRTQLLVYLITKVKNSFPKEYKDKLKGYNIYIIDDIVKIGRKGGRLVGECSGKRKKINYYLTGMPIFNGNGDIHDYINKMEKKVEHELLHAAGMSETEIYKHNMV